MIHLPETPKMVMATNQDTIIPLTTPDLDLPHTKAWERPGILLPPGTVGSIRPSTGLQDLTGTPVVTGRAEQVPTRATVTGGRARLHAGAHLGNTTRTQAPTLTRRCTAGRGGTVRGIQPGRGIREDLPYPPQALRDNPLKLTIIPPASSTRTSSRREELDQGVPPVQAPGPQVQEDHLAQGLCRGLLNRAVLPTP